MKEFAIFLKPNNRDKKPSLKEIKAHCKRLDQLCSEGRLICGGPFYGSAAGGGMYIGRFRSYEEAASFACEDPFVLSGYETFEVKPWEWSRPENGHLGMLPSHPGFHPSFLESLALRSTTREFRDQSISKDLIHALLNAAIHSPSEFNIQPWTPLILLNSNDKNDLASCCFNQKHVSHAPVILISAVNPTLFTQEAKRSVDERIKKHYLNESKRETSINELINHYESSRETIRDASIRCGAIFAHQFLLAAFSQGLAGFWLGGFEESKLKNRFHIPDPIIITGIVGIGWPKAFTSPMPRKKIEDIVRFDRWD